MDIYNKIKTIIEKGGLDVVVQDKYNNFIIFSTIEENGNIRNTGTEKTIQDGKNNIGMYSNGRITINRISKEDNWKIVKTIARQSHYKVGEKVKLKINGKRGYKYGKICKITGIWHGINEYVLDDYSYRVNATEIEPYFGEKEAEEMTLKQVCKEIGRNIKIIK